MVKISKLGQDILIGEPSKESIAFLLDLLSEEDIEMFIKIYLTADYYVDISINDISFLESFSDINFFIRGIFNDISYNNNSETLIDIQKKCLFNIGFILNFNSN